MFQLSCSVRNCGQALQRTDSGLRCSQGHCFDRAKQGYYNLLQPQDSRSANPGDRDEAVEARQRWLARGYMTSFIDALRPWCAAALHSDGSDNQILDLGCGEGTFGVALFGDAPETYCGVDLSRRAIRMATKRMPAATWVQANADRRLPSLDGSTNIALSLFGRRPIAEIMRALAPAGSCIVAVPATTDLIELREQVQQEGHERSRWEAIAKQFAEGGLRLCDRTHWQHRPTLDEAAIADALAMTYRGVRHSQQQRLATVESMTVTLSADLMLFQHA